MLGLCVSCVCSEDRSSRLSGSFYSASQTSAKEDPSCRSTLFPDTSSPPSPQLQIYLVSGRGETGLKIHLLPLYLESIFLALQWAVEDAPQGQSERRIFTGKKHIGNLGYNSAMLVSRTFYMVGYNTGTTRCTKLYNLMFLPR